MSEVGACQPVIIEGGTAGAALEGEDVSGDLAVIHAFPGGALMVVIDGLGHGSEAALAAGTAKQLVLEEPDAHPIAIVERCHEGLRRTRGVVMSVVSFDARQGALTWIGVGNVEGVLFRTHARTLTFLGVRGGVVGYRLPPLRAETFELGRGDTVVLATDGLRGEFKNAIDAETPAQELADTLLAGFSKGSDDACVAVARYLAIPGFCVPLRHNADVSVARQRLRELAYRRGFEEVAVEGLATALSELAHNVLVHGGGGEISITFAEEKGRSGLQIVASDQGPGIADLGRAMQDGYSTGSGLGLGMSSARRFVDEFEVSSGGKGTVVTLKKWLR